jgi:hypothetical protein
MCQFAVVILLLPLQTGKVDSGCSLLPPEQLVCQLELELYLYLCYA